MTSDLDLAQELADLADRVSTGYFAAGSVPYETKADGSPVTAADREIEERLLGLVGQRRPEDAFLGEEVGAAGAGERRWIVDGIDGTRAFAVGAPQWGGGPWDHAAFVVIVEEAGGCFRDLWGGRRLDTATALFASTTPIADVVLQLAAPLIGEATGQT